MLFAYLFGNHPEFGAPVARTLRRMKERKDTLCTCVFTVGEVLAGPSKTGDWAEFAAVKSFFQSPGIRLLDFDFPAAVLFAELRGKLGVTSADAIHLACAAQAKVDLFLTHDKRLARKIVPGVHFMTDLKSEIL
jgi:predicted nucleic acid-binding protein